MNHRAFLMALRGSLLATPEALSGLVADLVQRQVDVFLAIGPAAIRVARDASSTIPFVAIDLESDSAQAGFAGSFAQPGGNITGRFLDHPNLTDKWLELGDCGTTYESRRGSVLQLATGHLTRSPFRQILGRRVGGRMVGLAIAHHGRRPRCG